MKKNFIQKLGFVPKENSNNIFIKKFQNNYILEVDFENQKIIYGDKIKSGRATTQNFKDEENWVVLECVNRLLEKGYNPEDIVLEQRFKVGHGANGAWLDILVKKNGKTFLMIECKTWGKEFEKEFKNLQKNGGQLLSYFLQDRDAEFLVLYTSNIGENYDFINSYKNEIVVIEDSYREMSNLEDLYERWNKQTKQNGVFENWIKAYKFESRALRYNDLIDIKEEDSSYIFNRFLEILRHNTVSDKPNAFNKMFTLFLCKIKDEIDNENTDNELDFQWIEGKDNPTEFQKRLTDLYKRGMDEFLSKQVTDFSDSEFEEEFGDLDQNIRKKLLDKITKLRLQKNNEFAIKEVFDDESFEENAKVLKEIVELLQNYKFRYTKKQPFLGEFFELLLTTGLKQEAGQFFTPVPIARFICRSIPLEKVIDKKIEKNNIKDILPAIIDYAAGSGHFLVESMEEIQKIINNKDLTNTSKFIKDEFEIWKIKPYVWAGEYIYGIEKDYRLVRTSKVGCYLHGDGIATVIHGDGLDNFEKSKSYKGRLKKFNKDDKSQNEQFDFVLSNPPYSVSAFKGNLKKELAEKDFSLFNKLTDQSSEIEALFIERTAQLLKEGGIAGIILPSSIMSNTGIYTKAREIILKNFEIISIVEFGSNTFMATGTNTITLFLRKRNKFFISRLENKIKQYFENKQDNTLNGIENAFSKYISEIWENINFKDYKTLLEKKPNDKIKEHDIFKEYSNKFDSSKLFDEILKIEQEKLFYFVMTYPQNIVLVKTGEKKTEKEFLGYEFSNRKGHEGIHPIQKGRMIDECTKLFDPEKIDNPEKASTYIYKAFLGENPEIEESLKNNIFRVKLSNLLTFDRTDFEKTISTNLKKKIKIESKWEIVKLGKYCNITTGKKDANFSDDKGKYNFFTCGEKILKAPSYSFDTEAILVAGNGNVGETKYYKGKFEVYQRTYVLDNFNLFLIKYVFYYFKLYLKNIAKNNIQGSTMPYIKLGLLQDFKIPLPPKEIQQKIIDEIGELEKIEEKNNEKIGELKGEIKDLVLNSGGEYKKLGDIIILKDDKRIPLSKNSRIKGNIPYYGASGIIDYINDYIFDERLILIGEDGAKWGPGENTSFIAEGKYWVNNHAHIFSVKEGFIDKFIVESLNILDLSDYITGSNVPKLNQGNLKNIKLQLPPLEKQKEIVAKIEILEKEIENLKQKNKTIPEKKKEILNKYL